jgi:hypothetical protein
MRKNTKKRRTNAKTRLQKSRWWGGDITKQDAFEKILSIGYEFETSSLANLQGIVEGGKLVAFLNRDTARTDVGEEQEDIIEVQALDENNEEVDKKEMSFLITNDVSRSPFVKRLNKLCETDLITIRKNQVKKAIKHANLHKYKEQIMEALESGRYGDVFGNLEALFENGTLPNAKKNILYEKLEQIYKQNDDIYKYIRTDQYDEATHSKKYDIRFKFSDSTTSIISCGTFSDVEWIATYYKPKKSKNVVLDTFINAIRNLCRHVDQYTGKIQGYLEMTTGTRGRDVQTKIENPLTRTIFYRPGEPLNQHYYMQTHSTKLKNEGKDLELSIDDCCITPQMTFATLIHNAFSIMKRLAYDSINNIPTFNAVYNSRVEELQGIEECVKLLIDDYNKTDTRYKIVAEEGATKEKKEIVSAIKNYIGLILYKLSKYLNFYLQQDPNETKKYLKDSLTFNSRHKNYALYKGLKRSIETLFKEQHIRKEEIPSIIQQLIVNERVLLPRLLDDEEYVDIGAFNIENILGRDDDFYGDPKTSLLSYFQFFEEPRNQDDNMSEDDEIIYYDWLEYEGVDIYSSQMDVQEHEGKQNKVLIEFRGFQRMIMPYMLNMADAELKRNMKNGICNKLSNTQLNASTVTSISNFKKLIQLYDDDEAYPEKGVKKKTRKASASKASKKSKKSENSKSKSK